MEEIQEAALAYYAYSSDDIKLKVKTFYKGLDTDGDGKISTNEFEAYVKRKWHKFKPKLFIELDRDRDGFLDFEEVIVFFYMINMRNSFCDGCGEYLKGLYFTCVECFNKRSSHQTFDVCLNCYRTGGFNHEHREFLDNYALLNKIWSDNKKKTEEISPLQFGLRFGAAFNTGGFGSSAGLISSAGFSSSAGSGSSAGFC